jgi:hypothetical protein
MERTLQRLIAIALLGFILWLAGLTLESDTAWMLWCIPVLVLVLEHLAFVFGVAQGFEIYHRMTPQQRRDVARILDSTDDDNNKDTQ